LEPSKLCKPQRQQKIAFRGIKKSQKTKLFAEIVMVTLLMGIFLLPATTASPTTSIETLKISGTIRAYTSPTFGNSSNSNATIAGNTALLSIPVQDTLGIQGYIFSSNITGNMGNSTYTVLAGMSTSVTINASIVMPPAGNHVAVQWFANNTDGTWGSSSLFTLTSYFSNGLTIIGNQIFTASGIPVTLKGMDYTYFILTGGEGGSWMMPDGSIQWTTNPMSTTGVANLLNFMQASNATVVRVLMTVQFWLDNSNNYQSNLEYFITQAANRGIYTDLVFWNNNATDSTPSGVLPWDDAGNGYLTNSNDFVNLWGNVSNTLKNYSSVLFELWNEPNSITTSDEAVWFNVSQQCIDRIRSTGATQPLIIQWGVQLSYDFYAGQSEQLGVRGDMSWVFSYPLADPSGNLIYSQHIYAGNNNGFYTSNGYTMVSDYSNILYALTEEQVFAVAAIHPVFIGEIGDNLYDTTTTTDTVYINGVATHLEQDVYFNNTLALLDQNGIGYAGWAAPPWRSGSGTAFGYVMAGEANYTLDNSGVILVEHMGGINYKVWLSIQA
jgi:hypothetical protein